MYWLYWTIAVIVEFLCIYLCASIAARKGYSPLLWAILGFFFFFISLIVLLVLPDRNRTA